MSENDEEYSDYDPEEDNSNDDYDESSSDDEEENDDIDDIKFEKIAGSKLPLARRYIEKKNIDTRMTMSIFEYGQLVGAMAQIIAETGKCEIDNAKGLSPKDSAKEHIRQKKAWFYIRRITKIISPEEYEVEIIHANDMSLPLNAV